MANNQEWFNRKFPKDKDIDKIEIIAIDCENFDENSLIIEDYPNLKEINISESEKIRKLTLKDLVNLKKCTVRGCEVEQIIIENCPNIELLDLYNNFLTNLEFVKNLFNLSSLEISKNEKVSSGVEYLPDNLEKFSYKRTELAKVLETHNKDWKKFKQHLKEKGISEEENNRRELLSLKEENEKLDKKYKNLKENVGEVLTLLTSLKNKVANDPTTKEMILNLERNVKEIVDENNKLKDDLEQFKPLFNEEAPIIEASKLGSGSFGAVYKGVWKTQFAAVKKAFANTADETELAKIKKELKILKNLRSSYTIQYYSEYQKDNGIYLVMEYAEHGSLTKFITDNKDKEHDWQLNYNFIRQMVKGLRYLHSESVLHRDLKSHNVLITEGYIAKLADFGLAKLLDSSHKSSSGEKLVGTMRWLAPEVLESSKHSYYSDIYSLGMVMWEMSAKNTRPFKDLDNEHAVIFQVGGNKLKETIPSDIPENICHIIEQCWKTNPNERISLENILKIIGGDKKSSQFLELQKTPLQNSENNEQTYSSDSSGFDINKLNLDELNIQEQSSLQAQVEIPPKK